MSQNVHNKQFGITRSPHSDSTTTNAANGHVSRPHYKYKTMKLADRLMQHKNTEDITYNPFETE